MIPFLLYSSTFIIIASLISAQSSTDSGYSGYNLSFTGEPYYDPYAATYSTADTPANVSTTNPPPDVYLNASVHVSEIDILVSNITAKINLDVQVLKLLHLNAGVDAHIDRVSLTIKEVNAEVLLEARLGNIVIMVGDVLNSLDLNPILATLGQDVNNITNTAVGGLTGGVTSDSAMQARSLDLGKNILYSVNDYSGNTHTNRILEQDGSIIDQSLDNDGNIHSEKTVGSYSTEMTFNGYDHSVTRNGQALRELEYVYAPFPGLSVVSAIYKNEEGKVVGAQVLVESGGGGSSTVSN